MNRHARKVHVHNHPGYEEALRRLADAARHVEQDDTAAARAVLREAVDAARQVGIGWTVIGKLLGIASGNAYHRYRNRPTPSGGRDCGPLPR